RIAQLESELAAAVAERGRLERQLGFYAVTKVVAVVAICFALGLGFMSLVALARARDETRRRVVTLKHVESLRAAVDKYRSLGAQLELKYHNLFRQTPADPSTEVAVQALRETYDEERAPLEETIGESESALVEGEKAPSGRRRGQHKAA